MSGIPRFVLYSRPDCHLCEQLLEELAALLPDGSYQVDVIDVDADPLTRRRWGLKIPVLLLEGAPLCHGRLDGAQVQKALATRARTL